MGCWRGVPIRNNRGISDNFNLAISLLHSSLRFYIIIRVWVIGKQEPYGRNHKNRHVIEQGWPSYGFLATSAHFGFLGGSFNICKFHAYFGANFMQSIHGCTMYFALVFLPALVHEWIWYIYITDCFHVVYTQRGQLIWFDRLLKWLMWEKRLGTPVIEYNASYQWLSLVD